MTRINCVPVEELTDNFLLAEFFELPRIFVLARKHYDAGRKPEDLQIPDTYRLGEGHMRFFYNKMMYLATRHYQLGVELLNRNQIPVADPATDGYELPPLVQSEWWNDYKPTPEAIQLNWDRLQYRRRYEGGSYAMPNT